MKSEHFRLDKFRRLKLILAVKELVEKQGGHIVSKKLYDYGEPTENEKIREPFLAINMSNKDETITTNHSSGLSFVLNDVYYSFAFNDNVFFPNPITKTQVLVGNIIKDTYGDDTYLSSVYVEQSIGSEEFTEEKTQELAKMLLKELSLSRFTKIAYINKDIEVENTYNNDTHIEKIKESRKFRLYELKPKGEEQ